MSTVPLPVPLNWTAWGPICPPVQVAPDPRVPVFPLPEESAAVVPPPSSRVQWPARAGPSAAATPVVDSTPASNAEHAVTTSAARVRALPAGHRRPWGFDVNMVPSGWG